MRGDACSLPHFQKITGLTHRLDRKVLPRSSWRLTMCLHQGLGTSVICNYSVQCWCLAASLATDLYFCNPILIGAHWDSDPKGLLLCPPSSQRSPAGKGNFFSFGKSPSTQLGLSILRWLFCWNRIWKMFGWSHTLPTIVSPTPSLPLLHPLPALHQRLHHCPAITWPPLPGTGPSTRTSFPEVP